MDNPYVPRPYKVLSSARETADTFTMTVGMAVLHSPGQFVQVSVPGYGEAPISICSDSRKEIKLNIRQVGAVTNALAGLKKGETVLLRGPYGKGYPMKKLNGKDIVIVGGGCGVAPLKGLIDYVENHRKDFGQVSMFLGYRSPDDIIFKKELAGWKKKYSINVTVDKKGNTKSCIDAREGFVTDALGETDIRADKSAAMICAPPIMMKGSIGILKSKGFRDKQILVSTERLMYCAMGVCCHCMIRSKFTCLDGPVFRYDEIMDIENG